MGKEVMHSIPKHKTYSYNWRLIRQAGAKAAGCAQPREWIVTCKTNDQQANSSRPCHPLGSAPIDRIDFGACQKQAMVIHSRCLMHWLDRNQRGKIEAYLTAAAKSMHPLLRVQTNNSTLMALSVLVSLCFKAFKLNTKPSGQA